MNNRLLIDIGSPRDNRSLPLATKRGTHIPNVRWPEELRTPIRQASIDALARPNRKLLSWSATYNCMGLVFASRRTQVDVSSLTFILREDEYRRLSGPDEAQLGDVVVYCRNGEAEHVGLVAEIVVDLGSGRRDLRVISKWGRDGEYLHDLFDVLAFHGAPTEYWTHRSPT